MTSNFLPKATTKLILTREHSVLKKGPLLRHRAWTVSAINFESGCVSQLHNKCANFEGDHFHPAESHHMWDSLVLQQGTVTPQARNGTEK